MKKQRYKQVQAGVVGFIGLVMAVSVVLSRYEIAMIGVVLGILVLYTAGKQVDEVIRDERNAMIQQKASTMTLSITTIGLVFAGIAVEELSYRGFEHMRGYGSFMTYIAMGIMVHNSLFTWYYGKQMGD